MSGTRSEAPEVAAVTELKTALNKAYLSGNGNEVERVMALLDAAKRRETRAA